MTSLNLLDLIHSKQTEIDQFSHIFLAKLKESESYKDDNNFSKMH